MTRGVPRGPVLVAVVAAVVTAVATPAAAHASDVDPADGMVHVHVEEDEGVLGNGAHVEVNVTCSADDPGEPSSCSAHRTVDPRVSVPDLPCFWIGGTYVCVL